MRTAHLAEDTLKGIIGKHFIYTYDNGWQYEFYVKNADTFDYRIHSGMVGGRWVKDQMGKRSERLHRRAIGQHFQDFVG